MSPYTQHAEELSRAISEIDLNALRARADSGAEKSPGYTTDELFTSRPEQEPVNGTKDDGSPHDVNGFITPDIPTAPPPTPAQPSPGPAASRPENETPSITPLQEIAEEDSLEVATEQPSKDDSNVKEETRTLPEPDEPSKIRRQVEYYFSDDNLPDDVFLWKRTEGSNLPIKVETIAGFGRMRQYEYPAVVAALNESTFLDITGSKGQEMVKRKKPYDPANPISHADTYTDYEKYPYAYKPENIAPNPIVRGEKSKKKKKSKSSGAGAAPKVKQPKPTGFEEFYADPPTTPDEALDEYNVYYHPTRPFHERIQNCVQRYRARRKLDSKRANIFTQYLLLGGLDSGVKQFTGGLDENTLEDSTADEIASMRATDYIHSGTKNVKFYDPADDRNWVIDFEGVIKGFFSYRIPFVMSHNSEDDIRLSSAVLKNFLNYVLQHGACPEFTDDIMAARKICDKAVTELCAIQKLSSLLPGSYNIAASTLYHGEYKGQYIDETSPLLGADGEELSVSIGLGMSDPQAERIFKTAVAFLGKEQYLPLIAGTAKLVKTEDRYFEVVKIHRADIKTIGLFSGVKDHNGETGKIKALGWLKVKPWEGPGIHEEDGSDSESTTLTAAEDVTETFWLEDEILQHFFEGLKLEIVARELDVGIKYFDSVRGIYCSFFTYLENEKMKDWKEPVLSERPGPTEDDPDTEEAIMEDDLKDFD